MDIEVRHGGPEPVYSLPYGTIQAQLPREGNEKPVLIFIQTNWELPQAIVDRSGTAECPIEIRPLDKGPSVFIIDNADKPKEDLRKAEEWMIQSRGRGVQFETRILVSRKVFGDLIQEAFETVTVVDRITKAVNGSAASGNQLELDL